MHTETGNLFLTVWLWASSRHKASRSIPLVSSSQGEIVVVVAVTGVAAVEALPRRIPSLSIDVEVMDQIWSCAYAAVGFAWACDVVAMDPHFSPLFSQQLFSQGISLIPLNTLLRQEVEALHLIPQHGRFHHRNRFQVGWQELVLCWHSLLRVLMCVLGLPQQNWGMLA